MAMQDREYIACRSIAVDRRHTKPFATVEGQSNDRVLFS